MSKTRISLTIVVLIVAGAAGTLIVRPAWQTHSNMSAEVISFQTPFGRGTPEFDQLKIITDRFNSEQNGVKIDLLSDGPAESRRIIRQILAGKAPHIMEIPLDELDSVAARKLIIPIDLTSGRDEILLSPADIAPLANAASYINGVRYAAPIRARSLQLIYNAELIAAVRSHGLETAHRQTWRQIQVLFEDFNRKFSDASIYPIGIACDNNSLARLASMFVYQAGGELVTFRRVDDEPDFMWRLSLQDSHDSGVQALTFLSQLKAYSPPESTNWTHTDLLHAFADGRIAMFYGTSADVSRLRKLAPDLQTRVASVPRETEQVSTVEFYGAVIPAPAEYRQQCEQILRYLLSSETQTMVMQGGRDRNAGYPVFEKVRIAPIARPDYSEIEWYARHPMYKPFADALMYARSPSPVAGWREVANSALVPELRNLLAGETDAQTAVESITHYGNQTLSTYYGYIGHVYPTTVLGMSVAAVFAFMMIFFVVGHRSRNNG